MGGLWVPHRREDVACSVSTRNSFFTRLLPASDFLLPTSSPHRRGDMGGVPPGAKTFRPYNVGCADRGCPTGVKTLRATSHRQELPASDFLLPTSSPHRRGDMGGVPPGAKCFRPLQRGVRGSWVDCGRPTGVKTLRATSHRQEIPASNFHFLLPTSCFQLSLPASDFLLPTSLTPQAWGMGGGAARGENISPPTTWGARIMVVDCGCPTGVKTLRATSHRQELPASNFHFLLPTSCFQLSLPAFAFLLPPSSHRRGYGRRAPPGAKTFRPLQRGVRGFMGGLWVSHGAKTLRATLGHGFHLQMFTSCFRLPASDFVSDRRGVMAAAACRAKTFRP
jgi:hypothetical protein